MKPIDNPYSMCKGGWLRGVTHAHVDAPPDPPASRPYRDGVCPRTIYDACEDSELDFVCMALDVVEGGVELFGDSRGAPEGLIAIPAREIQNNYYNKKHDYFTAEYLHVLTLRGSSDVSICAHPAYYGWSTWPSIKADMLSGANDRNLFDLKVNGIEVYNGFAWKDPNVPRYYERAWDEMLEIGTTKYWGFAADDVYFNESRDFGYFKPVVGHIWVSAERDASSIVESLGNGRFYSSTLDISISEPPVSSLPVVEGDKVTVLSNRDLKWEAWSYVEQGNGWTLKSLPCDYDSNKCVVSIPKENWSFLRLQASDPNNSDQRLWLQPIFGPGWGSSN